MQMTDIGEKKQLNITGKNNIHKMQEVIDKGCNAKPTQGLRHKMKDLNTQLKQVDMINKMYMNQAIQLEEEEDEYRIILKQELEKKINGYKQQDIKKEMYDTNQLITFAEVVEKLVISKLKCAYCKCEVLLLYKNVREPLQWTLDRKYNDDCHSNENTLISCLKCNLERRVKNIDKFTFTKQLRIKKEM
jgi:hypothetical protein